jgi:outer membrane protein OmpA-like peptidoglycan-associated protein
MRLHPKVLLGAGGALLLAACATMPPANADLEQARADVRSLAQDPYAPTAAGQQLQEAENALSEANAAFENRRPADEVSHLAYLADRHALIGRAQTDEARARAQIAQAGAERDRLLLAARAHEAHLAEAQAQLAQQQAQQAREQAQSAEGELQRQQQQMRAEQEQLADLQARATARGLELTLGDVLFATNSATLAPGATLRLSRLATFMRANAHTRLLIEGYTDDRGSQAYNEQLSAARAESVADALQAQGIAPERLQVIGRGPGFPVATNDTAAGRQQNRRVDIVFSDMAGRFAQGAEAGPTQGPTLR